MMITERKKKKGNIIKEEDKEIGFSNLIFSTSSILMIKTKRKKNTAISSTILP